MPHFLVGKLTAVANTDIAMTVHDAFESTRDDGNGGNEDVTMITAVYFAGRVLQTVQLPEDSFVGFGDYLIFESGSFTAAGDHDDEEEDEDDEEPLDEDEDSRPA